MAGWTKADYDNAYSWRVERYMPTPAPTNVRPEVRVHYHKWAMEPVLQNRWAVLQPILNIQGEVCVVGAGFGWGVDALIAESGATVVGIDISDYIAAEQTNTEEAELRTEIAAVGLDPDTGRGLEIMNFIFDNSVRSNVIILQEDAKTQQSRQAIRAALGGSWPTVVIYEDIIDDTWTDQDIVDARNAGNGFGGQQRLIFVYKGTSTRTHQDLFDLLPGTKEVISTDGQVYLS